MSNDKTAGQTAERFRTSRLYRGGASRKPEFGIGRCLARAVSFLLFLLSLHAFAANEETFATLKVGAHTYRNVRVTTKGKNFIIIFHSGGITSIKVSELPADILQKLGYAPAPKKHKKSAAMWAGLASQQSPPTDRHP